jgi:thioredoxin 1
MAPNVNTHDFDREVLASEVPVLVDFWAPWCPPCRKQLPVVEELADETGGRFKVAKVNVDEAAELADRYGVSSIPTLLIFRGGEVVERLLGVHTADELRVAVGRACPPSRRAARPPGSGRSSAAPGVRRTASARDGPPDSGTAVDQKRKSCGGGSRGL